MRKQDYGVICALSMLAAFVWLRDLRWLDALGDTVPILAGLPLFACLKRPWTFSTRDWRLAPGPLATAAFLFPVGILVNSALLLAASWTALLWSWISVQPQAENHCFTRKLLVLPLVSFPWMTTDLERVGWWFRLSGAATAERLLAWGQFDVIRHGTFLSVAGFSVSVEPACSGVNGLEAMFIAGAALAYLKLKRTNWYWWNLPLLAGAAWMANVIRILFAALCGLGLNREGFLHWFGPLHQIAGWLALCAMFSLCWLLFSVQERLAVGAARFQNAAPADRTLPRPKARFKFDRLFDSNRATTMCRVRRPWLECLLLGYCVWRCRDLAGAWAHNPFDRLGWLAFLLWLVPIALPWFSSRAFSRHSEAGKMCLLGAGLALTFVGDIGDLNFSHHLGLALVVMSFAPRTCLTLFGAGAVAWLPASGWIGSRIGLDPETFVSVRLLVAVLGVAWGLRAIRWRNNFIGLPHVPGNQIAP